MRGTVLFLLSGLSFAALLPVGVLAQPASITRPSQGTPYADHIVEAAQRFALPAAWIRAVLRAESAGDSRAISPKGAMGLMQIMPGTWANLRMRLSLGSDPYDPHDNIIAGAAYIRELFDRYGSPGWIAAYNAGPGRYEASLSGRPLPAETRAYVASVSPALGGGSDSGTTVIAPADPFAWTRAPLFIAQRASTPTADPAPEKRASDDAPGASSSPSLVRDVSAIVPQSNGLFIARADTGTMR
ncbi:MAG TPA: lytic transglycosylase domain-containing protein [Beijerinckiaceae bacterium]|nr:lytic transglycosylase domain-containing protein [Beijerinckiaceae bacterium]